jgi:7,8-dihydro-6-hydroxymethylpterin dimethyltransferase
MECQSCETPVRKDKPHTFFAHEMSPCPGCGEPIEGRVVVRDGRIVNLTLCPHCGQREREIAADARAWVDEFITRGVDAAAKRDGVDRELKRTTSTCPTCLQLLEARVVICDGRVYFEKYCATHGDSRALVSEDAEYYVRAYGFARAGTEPLVFGRPVEHGCPTDCGTCDDHEQHTCMPIIEVTDHCNLECPICIVNNEYSNHIAPDDFRRIVDMMVRNEGYCEQIILSGGEPTSHPKLIELLNIATRPEVGRVVIITNGLRIARDREFAQAIAATGAYVALQLDGFDDEVHRRLRGKEIQAEKETALRVLRELGITTQLIFVAVRGVNDHQIGRAVELLLDDDNIISLSFQPVAFTGRGGGLYEHDPLDRITIPGVIHRIEDQTGGRLRASDFSPLPCSHPQCVSLTYLLKLNDGSFMPFARFVDFTRHNTLLRSSASLIATSELHDAMLDVIHDVYSDVGRVDRGEDVLGALRRTLDVMFPARPLSEGEKIRVGEKQAKSIFMHHYMDRYDFDLERLRKCCHHYPQLDGRVMPACGYNMFHRGAALGPDTGPVAAPVKRQPHSLPILR